MSDKKINRPISRNSHATSSSKLKNTTDQNDQTINTQQSNNFRPPPAASSTSSVSLKGPKTKSNPRPPSAVSTISSTTLKGVSSNKSQEVNNQYLNNSRPPSAASSISSVSLKDPKNITEYSDDSRTPSPTDSIRSILYKDDSRPSSAASSTAAEGYPFIQSRMILCEFLDHQTNTEYEGDSRTPSPTGSICSIPPKKQNANNEDSDDLRPSSVAGSLGSVSLKGRRRREDRFEGGTLDIEWIIAGSNVDYLAHHARQFFEPYGEPSVFVKLVSDVRSNYIVKELTNNFEQNHICNLFDQTIVKNDPKYILQAYTADTNFFGVLNMNLAEAQLNESESVDIKINKYCASLVGIIVYHASLASYSFYGKCYRGMSIPNKELDKYKKGTRILTKSFLSTSRDPRVAVAFADKSTSNGMIKILCIYTVQNPRSGLDLETMSEFPEEKEVLIMPYTSFKIMEVQRYDSSKNNIGAEIRLKECEPW